MFSGEIAELKELIKQQLLGSMFLGIPLSESDEMVLPEFKMVHELGREIQKEVDSQDQGGSLPSGVVGRARIF